MSEQLSLGTDFLDTSRKYWALISGGKDSMTTAHYLASKGCLEGCLFIDTGICANQTRAFIENIKEYHVEIVPTTIRYESIVWKYGFPRHKAHKWTKDRLKGRAIQQFIQKHKGESPFLASGTRRLESATRKRQAKPISEWEKLPVVSPLFNWTTDDVWSYIRRKDVLLSPVYLQFDLSGDCFCGAHAQPYERPIIKKHFPEIEELISKLEVRYGGLWGNQTPLTKEELSQQPLECMGDCLLPKASEQAVEKEESKV